MIDRFNPKIGMSPEELAIVEIHNEAFDWLYSPEINIPGPVRAGFKKIMNSCDSVLVEYAADQLERMVY